MSELNGKSPTWQWLAGIAVSLIILLGGVMAADTRQEGRESRSMIVVNSARLTALETAYEIGQKADKEWRDEVRIALKTIAATLDSHERSTRAIGKMKQWQDYPTQR
jgi:uncharacterized membrane protein